MNHGQAIKGYAVVLQPAEPVIPAAATRYLRVLRRDQDGSFRVKGLPPGRHDATAVASLEQGRHFVAEVQRRLRETARRFTLGEGASLTLDLTLTEGFD